MKIFKTWKKVFVTNKQFADRYGLSRKEYFRNLITKMFK